MNDDDKRYLSDAAGDVIQLYLMALGTRVSPEAALKMLIIQATLGLACEVDIPATVVLRGLLHIMKSEAMASAMAARGFQTEGPRS